MRVIKRINIIKLINRVASGMYIIRLLESDGKEYVQKMISGRE
jgi:hypothetical protein